MVESVQKFGLSDAQKAADAFEHVYECPRQMDDERERRMAFKMISTIDQMKASADNKDRIKQLYVHSDELAWLGEHFNRENDDTEILFKEKRAKILKVRDQIINGELTDFSALLPDYEKSMVKLKLYEE